MKVSDIQVTPIHPERWGDDLDVVNAARVSFHKESNFIYKSTEVYEEFEDLLKDKWQDVTDENGWVYTARKLKDSDVKLINYLAKHKHFSPFNHSFISVRIKAPIFVARQLVKHKFMPWNEVSRRYVDEEPEFYIPQARKRSENAKQGSADELVSNIDMKHYGHEALQDYKDLLTHGVAPEVARSVLPQTMMTEWIWSGTLGAFCDMLVLRLDPHTQYESRIVANKIKELIEPIFPVSLKARLEN